MDEFEKEQKRKNKIISQTQNININNQIKLTEDLVIRTEIYPSNYEDKSIIIDEILKNQLVIMKLLQNLRKEIKEHKKER